MPNFSANASVLGYFYQVRYALLLLLKAEPGQELSVERFDDIAFEENDSPVELIQTKHHAKKGSLSNRSPDLWKTIRVWCNAELAKRIDLDRTKLIIATTRLAPPGSAAAKLRPDESNCRDINGAFTILKRVASEPIKHGRNGSCYDEFMKLGEQRQKALLKQVLVLDASPTINDVGDEIKQLLKFSASLGHTPHLFESLEGWWLQRMIKHLSQPTADTISFSEVNSIVDNLREQFKRDNLPIDFLDATLPPEQIDESSKQIFVKQLELVKVERLRIHHAISDYYKAYQQRSKWLREELLYDKELDSYESRLQDEWERRFSRMKGKITNPIDNNEKEIKGKELYDEFEFDVDIPIRKETTEKYVMRGSYQMLADNLKVGWHSEFKRRLRK